MTTTSLTDQRAPQAWDAAWADALNDLELDVAAAESLLAACHTGSVPELTPAGDAWAPPALEGLLPGNLHARAEAILDRQVRVSHALSRGMAASRRELRLAQRMDSGLHDRSTPAFLDTKY
jgi:hypothetical protein